MLLQDRVVAVTGGFGSVGVAVVKAAESAGAKVIAIDRMPVDQAPHTLSNTVLLGDVDLGISSAAEAAFKLIWERCGQLDALVNVAGTFRWELVETGAAETWDFLYGANLRTAFNASKEALPYLQKRGRGRIINIGAAAAAKAAAGMGAYAASKAGVAKLTEALAEELKGRNITVNAVLPSIVDTPQNRADMPNADFSRWVSPQALADVIVFLLSDQAEPITGALIPVTGRV
ncbi:MAG: Dehydrogenase [Nevskia sp.]|nr:Dehydrogenase [Nevskia sp.]